MYEVKATSIWVAPETYIVNELAMELRARQYIVEVSEIESED